MRGTFRAFRWRLTPGASSGLLVRSWVPSLCDRGQRLSGDKAAARGVCGAAPFGGQFAAPLVAGAVDGLGGVEVDGGGGGEVGAGPVAQMRAARVPPSGAPAAGAVAAFDGLRAVAASHGWSGGGLVMASRMRAASVSTVSPRAGLIPGWMPAAASAWAGVLADGWRSAAPSAGLVCPLKFGVGLARARGGRSPWFRPVPLEGLGR